MIASMGLCRTPSTREMPVPHGLIAHQAMPAGQWLFLFEKS